MGDEADGLWTVADVAARLGVHERTVYTYEASGKLRAALVRRQGLRRRLWFDPRDVVAFAEANGIPSNAE